MEQSVRRVPVALRRALTYIAASVAVFLVVMLALQWSEAFRLSEPWDSPRAIWRNIEATWADFLRLGGLTLFPAAGLGTFGRSEWVGHGITALVSVLLLVFWSAVGGTAGNVAMIPVAELAWWPSSAPSGASRDANIQGNEQLVPHWRSPQLKRRRRAC